MNRNLPPACARHTELGALFMEIKHALMLDSKDPLSKALGELMDTGTAVIVTRKGKYVGTIDDRSMGSSFQDAGKTLCETVIAKPPTLLPSATMLQRIDAFLSGHFKALPVVDENGNPMGITTRVELLQDMLGERIVPNNRVADLMNAPVYTIDENECMHAAKSLLKMHKCNRLVVTRNGKPAGVISTLDMAAEKASRDVMQKRPKGITDVKSQNDRPVREFFRSDITIVGETDTVEEAAKRMVDKKVSSVVVVSKHRPVGVFSAVDLFKRIQDVAKGEFELVISGLGQENITMYPYIKDKIGGVLEKFLSSFEIRNAKVRVKEEKSVFDVDIYFDKKDGHVSMSGSRSTLKETVDELAEELDRVLCKAKEKRKLKQRKTHKTKIDRMRGRN